MKTLVAYFSRVGENSVNGSVEYIEKGFTEIVAEKIAKYTDGELYKLQPEVPYPINYQECVKRASKEDADNATVLFLNKKDNLDDYDVIYIGFPNWYRSFPRIVATFLKSYNLIGKTIKPFCTNEEGAFGIGEIELKAIVKGAIIKQGYACRGHEASSCDDSLKAWIEK